MFLRTDVWIAAPSPVTLCRPRRGGVRRTRCAVELCSRTLRGGTCGTLRRSQGGRGRRTLCAVERRAVEHVERCAIPRVWSTNASWWGQWVKVLVVEATLLLVLGSVVER